MDLKKTFSLFKAKHPNITLLALCLTAAAVISVFYGQDNMWDLKNYHIYNPFAFFNGRLSIDIIPAGMHTFFSPAIDFPHYFVLKYLNAFPRLAAVLLSVWLGLTFFFTAKITEVLSGKKDFIFLAVLACIIFYLSPAAEYSLSVTGDIMTTPFVLAALLLTFMYRSAADSLKKWSVFAAAGALMGAAFGLKFTNASFVFGYGLVLIFSFSSFKEFFKGALSVSAGFLTAFLIVDGYWLWKMYVMFQNPLFPFYNDIFLSKWFEPLALIEPRFIEGRGILFWLALPFSLMYLEPMVIIESEMRTITFLAYVISCAGLIYLIIKNLRKKSENKLPFQAKNTSLLILFFAAGMIVWMKVFGVIRYIIPLESAGAVLIVIALSSFFNNKYRYFFITAISLFIALFTISEGSGQEFGTKILSINTVKRPYSEVVGSPVYNKENSLPEIKDGAVVILAGTRLSFLIPYLNQKAVYVGGIPADHNNYGQIVDKAAVMNTLSFPEVFYKHNFGDAVLQTIQNAQDLYVMTYTKPSVFFKEPLYHYNVKINPEKCNIIFTNIEKPVWLCEAQKI